MYLGAGCLIAFLGLAFHFAAANRRWKGLENKVWVKGWLGIFYAGCGGLLRLLRVRFGKRLKGERLEQLRKLYVGKGEEELFYCFYGKRFCILSALIMGGMLLISIACLLPKETKLLNGYFLEREGVLGAERRVGLSASLDGEKKDVTVCVPRKKYTAKQLEQKFQEAMDYVNQQYLGKNFSPEQIDSPLRLVKTIPESAIAVSWELGSDGLVQEDGSLANADLKESCQTEITAIFSYGETERSMVKMLTILPRQRSQKERSWEEWQQRLEQNQKESRERSYLKLPEQIGGKKVEYREKSLSYSAVVTGIVLCLPVIVLILQEERLRRRLLHREMELRRDYPEFVEQFALLVGAGLNIRGAWLRIAADYEKASKEKHYVYEEMLFSIREMEHGMSETRAYEMFGKRTGLLQYMKFCTMLVQNLRKGSDDLLDLLDYEVADAFRERKENAKAMGEEAGTKLLLPMMLMLVIVFVMILYSAFYNM